MVTQAKSTMPEMYENFSSFKAQADGLAPEEVRPMKLDVELVVFNGATGVGVVTANREQITKELPLVSWELIVSLEPMGQALRFAASRVDRKPPTPTQTRALVKTAFQARGAMLAKALVAVNLGLLDAGAVEAIRRGRGPVDTGNDCIALATLMAQNLPAFEGKVLVTPQEITDTDNAGRDVLRALKPESARRPPDKELHALVDTRDRVWTLYERTWERNVWRAGAWLFGRDVQKHVPLLGNRVRGRKHAVVAVPSPAPAPAPAPAPSPSPAPSPTSTNGSNGANGANG